jgi:hypothetical protein
MGGGEPPVSFRGGKSVRARVQVPGRPDTEREDTWQAHQPITEMSEKWAKSSEEWW